METFLKAIICIVFVAGNMIPVRAQNDALSRVNFKYSYGYKPTNDSWLTFKNNRPTVSEDTTTLTGQIQVYFYLDGSEKLVIEDFDEDAIYNKGDNEYKLENGESIYFDGNIPHIVVDDDTQATNEYLAGLIMEYEKNPTESLVMSIWKAVEAIKSK